MSGEWRQLLAIVAMIGIIAGMLWILGITLSFFYNLVMPLCVAGIFALVLYPMVDYLEQLKWLNRMVAMPDCGDSLSGGSCRGDRHLV